MSDAALAQWLTATRQALGPSHGVKFDKHKLQVWNENNYSYVTARSAVGVSGGGRWYHEVTLESNGQFYLGFVLASCPIDANSGGYIGQDEASWGWDGSNGQRWWAGKSERFGDVSWQQGDVIGVSLDLDTRRISFSRNGQQLGVCFSDVPTAQTLYAACSLRRYQKVTFNFGATPFRFPDRMAYPYNMSLNDKQRLAVEKLFEHYQKMGKELSVSQEDRGDVIPSEGVFQFATEAGAADDTDPLLLVVAHRLHCEKPWEIARDEWVRGFSLFGLHDITTIRAAAARWKAETLNEPELFKAFYNWTFDYLREDRKILSIEEAKTLWAMLGMAGRWKLWQQWLEFLEKKKRPYLSRDEYSVVLTFATEHPNSIDKYDPDGPWPVLIDDFVAFVRGEDE